MKLFLRPRNSNSGVLAFDLDNTLYNNPGYIAFQEESQLSRLASFLGTELEQARQMVQEKKAQRERDGLPPTSLATIFREFGISQQQIVAWRNSELRPSDWLSRDPKLRHSIILLATQYRLALLTNNPHKVAEESLQALGVDDLFQTIIALDDVGFSKPHRAHFDKLMEAFGGQPEDYFVIGDRFDIDIKPALDAGMSGILVDEVGDIYLLPDLLLEGRSSGDLPNSL
ncbi:MAG: HAD family hydrolase [Rectinemataceae bacterium]